MKSSDVKCESELVRIEEQAWDTQMLGLRVARISDISGKSTAPNYQALHEHLIREGFEYVTVRCSQDDFAQIQALEKVGFQLVDGIIKFHTTPKFAVMDSSVRLGDAQDAERVANMAARTFTRTRFHNDPVLNQEKANRVHLEWARNSCLGKAADAVLLIEKNGEVAAFSTTKLNKTEGNIVLVAVDPKHSGAGLGQKITQAACNWFFENGAKDVFVQTQTNNLQAMALYMRCGFRLHSSNFTLRWFKKK